MPFHATLRQGIVCGALLASAVAGAQAQSAGTCAGAAVQVDFGAGYPVGDYSGRAFFGFPHASASNSSPDVDFTLDVVPDATNPPDILKTEAAAIQQPDGSSTTSPWFVIARTNRQVVGPVGTVRYRFSKPVGNLGFGIGSIDSGGGLESVTVNAVYADGSSGPISTAVAYGGGAPNPPSSWPAQPTVYYAQPGASIANGVYSGNDHIYVAIPASKPVVAIDVTYSILAITTGGIGFTPPVFQQCTPAPQAVPAVHGTWLAAALALLLAAGAVLGRWRRR